LDRALVAEPPRYQPQWENPFFEIMPHGFLIFGIILATFATIIASQALISGTFTLVNEA
jgi:KUP system potassium uptake protein